MVQHKDILAVAGATTWRQVAIIIKQNGPTTARQMSGLFDMTPVLECFVGYGWVEVLDNEALKYYRLTPEGRKNAAFND